MPRQHSAGMSIRIPGVFSLLIAVLTVLTLVTAAATAQNPVPFIDQPLVPDAVAPGGSAFTLTVNGAGFVASSTVNWNGSPLTTTFVSSTRLTASVPASDIAAESTAMVTVLSPAPGGGVSNIQDFSISAPAKSVSFQPVQVNNANEQFTYYWIEIADLNGDGIPDVVIASQNIGSLVQGQSTGDGSVEIFLGNGDGTFQQPVSYNSGGGDPSSLAIADVNGDGKLDIVVGNQGNGNTSSGVGILLGNGDGTFQQVNVVSTLYSPSIVVADVNGDGKLDVIIASVDQDFIPGGLADVLLGNGDGTFKPPAVYSSGASGAGSIAVADVNGDGKLDLIMTGPCPTAGFSCAGSPYPDGIVSVLLGNGDGTFQSPLMYDTGGYDAAAVTVSDVNDDGKPDLLIGNCQLSGYGCQNATVAVLLGNGNGTFQSPVIYDAGTGTLTANVSSIAAADVNMDGQVDIVATTWFGSSVAVLLGNGNGTFQPVVSLNSGEAYPASVAVADLNRDGKPDAALVTCGGAIGCEGSLGVLLNDSGSVQTPTTTTVSSSLNPAIYGQTVTLTSTVSSASGLPTGTVTFYQGSTAVGSAALVNRSTSISVSTLVAGSQPITAVYQGCSAFGSSTSTQLNQIVSPATTSTSVTSSANPARPDKHITFTATVADQFSGTITGSVTFLSGTQNLGTIPISGNRAGVTTSFASTGTYSVSATYNGDANNLGSMSTLSQDIDYTTTTTLSSSLNPSIHGQEVLFTATVTSSFGAPPDGETVSFMQGKTVLGTGRLSGGSASFTSVLLNAGTDSIKAEYSGDPNFATSASKTVSQVVSKAATSTTLVSSENPSSYGQPVTFTATVTPQFGGTPTGSVAFYNGTVKLGAGKLSGGVASFTATYLAVGTDSITAQYEGSSSFDTSTTAAVIQTVNKAGATTPPVSSLNLSNFGQSESSRLPGNSAGKSPARSFSGMEARL